MGLDAPIPNSKQGDCKGHGPDYIEEQDQKKCPIALHALVDPKTLRCVICTPEKFEDQKSVREPSMGDSFYWLGGDGDIRGPGKWADSCSNNDSKDFLGVWKNREDAEAMRDKIRQFVQSQK